MVKDRTKVSNNKSRPFWVIPHATRACGGRLAHKLGASPGPMSLRWSKIQKLIRTTNSHSCAF